MIKIKELDLRLMLGSKFEIPKDRKKYKEYLLKNGFVLKNGRYYCGYFSMNPDTDDPDDFIIQIGILVIKDKINLIKLFDEIGIEYEL